jgi:hypothetical protein
MQNRVMVKPVADGWLVESPDESITLPLKTLAVALGRKTSKALPGRSLLIVLRQDGSVESAVEHGADRPPVTSYLHGSKPA